MFSPSITFPLHINTQHDIKEYYMEVDWLFKHVLGTGVGKNKGISKQARGNYFYHNTIYYM